MGVIDRREHEAGGRAGLGRGVQSWQGFRCGPRDLSCDGSDVRWRSWGSRELGEGAQLCCWLACFLQPLEELSKSPPCQTIPFSSAPSIL